MSSSKTPSAKAKAAKAKSTPPGTQVDHLAATIYFLEWQKTILEQYTKLINRLFVVPLTEHCIRKRVMNATVSSEHAPHSKRTLEAGRKLEAGVKIDDTNDELKQLQRRLERAKASVKGDGADDDEYYAPVLRQKWISIGEAAAMFRLRSLVQLSGSLLILVERVRTWIEAHRKPLAQYRRLCSDVLESAIFAFEAICVQADIFSLEPVDRSKVSAECAKFIESVDPYAQPSVVRARNQPLAIGESAGVDLNTDVKRLEAQINAYRVSAHLIGNSMTDITQNILKTVPRSQLEVTTKEIRAILERLPPAYRFAGRLELSAAGARLLAVAPPNRRALIDDVNAASDEASSSKRSATSVRAGSELPLSSAVPTSPKKAAAAASSHDAPSLQSARDDSAKKAKTPSNEATATPPPSSILSEKTQSAEEKESEKKSRSKRSEKSAEKSAKSREE